MLKSSKIRLLEVVNNSTYITIEKSTTTGDIGYFADIIVNRDSEYSSELYEDNGYVILASGQEKILANYVGTQTELVLPNEITKISDFAIANSRTITKVTLGENVTMPNATYYTNYASGIQLAIEGTYYFYSIDKSGNQSTVVNITLDNTKPIGTLYGGTSSIGSGSSTNADYVKFVPYDRFGLVATYVKLPGATTYIGYTSGAQYTGEGEYFFYTVDRAGNRSSTYTVILNRQIPAAQLFVDDVKIDNNSYTNGWHIRFECEETCFVKMPGICAIY